MVAFARRCFCLGFFALFTRTLRTDGASKCSEGNNAIEYGSDGCISIDPWYPSTMEKAGTTCKKRNGSGAWNLPKFDSASTAKWSALSEGIRKLSMTKAVFWIGLKRKGDKWKWLVDDSDLDESKAMWKNGIKQSESGNCVLCEWNQEKQEWIKSPCQNGSKVDSIPVLVCELEPMEPNDNGGVAGYPGANSNSPGDSGPWDAYGKWILVGVVLAVITVLIVIGTVLYVRQRHRRIEREQLMSRRDPPSISNSDSISLTDDSVRAIFDISESDLSLKEKEVQETKEMATSQDGIAIAGAEQAKQGLQGSTDEYSSESDTATTIRDADQAKKMMHL